MPTCRLPVRPSCLAIFFTTFSLAACGGRGDETPDSQPATGVARRRTLAWAGALALAGGAAGARQSDPVRVTISAAHASTSAIAARAGGGAGAGGASRAHPRRHPAHADARPLAQPQVCALHRRGRTVYGPVPGHGGAPLPIDADVTIAAPIWHDWAKALVFQWNADGSEFAEFDSASPAPTMPGAPPGTRAPPPTTS